MKARQMDRKAPPKRGVPWRWILFGFCGLLILVVCAMVVFGVWFVRSLREFQVFVHQAQSEYHALNAEFPFKPPVSGSVDASRFQSYLRAHDAVVRAIRPEDENEARGYLGSGSLDRIRLMSILRDAREFLEPVSMAHLEALKAEGMSLDEYLWLHGLVVREVMRKGPGDARKDSLSRTLADMKRAVSGVDREKGTSFNMKDFMDELDRQYQGSGIPPEEIIEAYPVPSPLAGVVDLLSANGSLAGAMRETGKANLPL